MDSVEQKLKRKNAVLVVNAVGKVVETVVQKHKAGCGNVNEFSEWKFLRQKCGDPESLIGSSACQGIISLVQAGVVSLPRAFSGFIAALTSARNYSGIVNGVGTLLVLDLKIRLTEKKEYRCPFTIGTPEHPMITIFKVNKDVWLDILSQMRVISCHENETIAGNSVELFRPLIMYILCGPSDVPSYYKLQTWDFVLKFQQNPSIDFLLDVSSQLQVDSDSEVESAVSIYSQLCEYAIKKKDTSLCAALSPTVASLAYQLVCKGHDPYFCFNVLVELLNVSPESGSCVLVVLSETISVCPAAHVRDAFKTCKFIIEQKICNLLSVKILENSILPWLVYPSCMTTDVATLGNEILNTINEMKVWSSHTGKLLSNKYFDILRPVDPRINMAAHVCRLGEVWHSNADLLETWLEDVSQAPKTFTEKLQNVLSALLLHPFGNCDAQQTALKLLLQLSEQREELSGSLLTLILYRLSTDKEPEVQLELLRAVVQTAVLKENITFILHTLETIRTRPKLESLVIDLYLRLWKVEQRCYPYLENMLREPPNNCEYSIELETARAAAIKEMCETRPDLHSAELVSLLSKILTRCGDASGSAASSLCLQGIRTLCKEGIADITTTWKALAPRMNRDKRPLVVQSWCDFMGVVPRLRCPTQDYEKVLAEVAMRLWNYALNSTDTGVVNAAFDALSNFHKDQLTLKGLPEIFRKDLKLPSAYAKTPVDAARKPEDVLPYIPSECWIKMLLSIKPTALEAAGNMLCKWLAVEVGSIHSLIGRAEPQSYSHLPPHCICAGLTHYLNKTYKPEEKAVVKECLRVLSQTFPKPLPPLNWMFLRQYLEEAELQEYVFTLASNQCSSSPSARKLLEGFLTNSTLSPETEDTVYYLFSNLGNLCTGFPPNVLRPFVQKSLTVALDQTEEAERNLKGEKFVKLLLGFIRMAVKKEDIHDANRTLLSQIIESFAEKLFVSKPFCDDYLKCVVELPTKYIERLSSPSVWWEVTPEKLRLSLAVRTLMACRADTEIPLVWLNECIDATTTMPGEHTNVLKSIAPVLVSCRGNENNCPWTLELMGQIQNTANNKADSNQHQVIIFLCDIFMLTVIILSGCNCLSVSLEGISTAREVRMRLFPQAIVNLLSLEIWNKVVMQVIEWLIFMEKNSAVHPLYSSAFRQALIGLRRAGHFSSNTLWFRILDSKLRTNNK